MSERGPPGALVTDPLAVPERSERRGKAKRHRDHPGQGEAEAGVRRATREQDHRGEGCGGCEHRVLERTQAEHSYARLPRLQPSRFERLAIDHEPTADDEGPEA